jgi:hypothetical protein
MGTEMGDFLRARRARVKPGEVGMPTGTGLRRIPGLRREELATLAGVSIDYYIRLEQGKERHPSAAVVGSLAAALRLNEEEHTHLSQLARGAERSLAPACAPVTHVGSGIRQLLETVRPCPAYVLGRTSDVLVANPEALALFTGLRQWAPELRNTMRYTFCHPAARSLFPDWEQRASDAVANLRAVAGTHPGAPDVAALIEDMSAASPDFVRFWDRHDILRRRSETKSFLHPSVGEVTFWFEVLRIENDQRVGIYQPTADPRDQKAVDGLARCAAENADRVGKAGAVERAG